MNQSNEAVLAFYRELPFNYGATAAHDADEVVGYDPMAAYPVLQPLIRSTTAVLDVGCGVGWLATSLALKRGCRTTGIDANPVVIARAREVAGLVGADVTFEEVDLFAYRPSHPFDVVVSLGVLHCTNDCRAAVLHCARVFIGPGGYFLLGLYHLYGRRPFLDHFADLRARGADEDVLFAEYTRLHRGVDDATKLRSWFRDQVLIPHETQHTLAEVAAWAEAADCDVVATSINRFEPLEDLPAVVESECEYEDIARQRLSQGLFFPGFFVTLLRRR